MPKYYVFRINYEESWQPLVRSAIDRGELRQGWGMQQGTDSLRVDQDESAFLKAWDKIWPGSEISYCKRKYSSLSKMLDFNNGDIIVVPKAPDWRQFLILTVNGSYRFDDDLNSKFNNGDDFRHIIPVEYKKTVGYDYSDDSRKIVKKFGAYRSPINSVYDKKFQNAINTLLQDSNKNLTTSQDELAALGLEDSQPFKDLKKWIPNTINNWGADKLEKLIQSLFEKNGFTLIKRNRHNNKGGDIDLVFAMPSVPLLDGILEDTPFPQVWIQAKNKRGHDANAIDGIKQLIEQKRTDNLSAICILINTTDCFDKEAKMMAESHDIILINGTQFARLILKYGIEDCLA